MLCACLRLAGGVLSCGLTHLAVTPLDLVKCNMQANPEKFKGLVQGFQMMTAEKMSLMRGWMPTLVGYSVQGANKFGFYEYFKYEFARLQGKDPNEKDPLSWAAASASAEFIADIGLCPFEAVKVRVQTDPGFANGLADGMPKLFAAEGLGGLYKGIVPLWGRQIPYTIMKFVAFEAVVRAIYARLPGKKEDYSYVQQLGVTFLAGYIAGVFCAVVSHPADTLVSKLNKKPGASIGEIYGEIGFGGLWRGLGTRIIMVGTLTGLQWFIYDSFKAYVGLPTSGGGKK